MTMLSKSSQAINVGTEADFKMDNTTDKETTSNQLSTEAEEEISTMAMTTDRSSTSGRSENQATINRTGKTNPGNYEALEVDELAGRSMGTGKQKLMFMSGHQLIQMAEMKIIEANKKNQTLTDQSYTKRRSNISIVKRNVKKDRSNQGEEIKVQEKNRAVGGPTMNQPTTNRLPLLDPHQGCFNLELPKLRLQHPRQACSSLELPS